MRRLAAPLLVVLVACSGVADPLDEGRPVRRDGVPDAFPLSFPIPPQAQITSARVDESTYRSEMTLVVGTPMASTVQFFTVNLVNEGYVVETSSGDDGTWTISFSKEDLHGAIVVTEIADGSEIALWVNSI